MNTQEKISLFTCLFNGRTDVFARRWERWGTDISGYSPVYADKEKQKYAPLNNYFIEQHLSGNVVLGVYPLLADNSSWLIVADFDGENWLESIKRFLGKWEEIAEENSVGENILIITHRGCLRAILPVLAKASKDKHEDFSVETGSLTKFSFDKEEFEFIGLVPNRK